MSRPIAPPGARDTECFTIKEFCAAHRIGLNTYYKLRKAGKGPVEMHVGKKALVTREAAARWRAAREAAEAGPPPPDD